MSLLVAWVAFPAVLAAVSLGCGLAVERAVGLRLPAALLPPLGVATTVVVAQFATATDATAELATPLVAFLAAAGLAAPGWWRGRRLDGWAAGAAVGVFCVFAAPVVLSGEATFAGYMKLDDTATWFALTDRVMEHGRDLDGLAPSTYEATLDFNLAQGYPVGGLLPLGVGRSLVAKDVAWVFQPYLALLGAMLALVLHTLAAPLVRAASARALVAFVAPQAALLYGYSLWGGVKEMFGALLVALAVAIAGPLLAGERGARATVPAAIATAAGVSALTPSGGVLWLAPILTVLLIGSFRTTGWPRLGRTWLAYGALTAALTVPWLPDVGFLPPTSSSLTGEAGRGNLLEPLSPVQLFGVWPVGDFRLDPDATALTYLLVVLVAGAGLVGLVVARRKGAWAPLLYVLAAGIGALVTLVVGSPWVEAKAMAIASPAFVFIAIAGALSFLLEGRQPLAMAAVLAIAGGVLGSNVLAYREVNLAPHDRLVELERVGERIAGQGPTLVPEYEPYAARHFLREADPEAVSELRRRPIARRRGGLVPKGGAADLDELTLGSVLAYRTLVVRRSPTASRPPSPYTRTWRGRHWDVWQRDRSLSRIAVHMPFGGERRSAAIPPCQTVMRVAQAVSGGGRIAAAVRDAPIVLRADDMHRPEGWEEVGAGTGSVVPDRSGTASTTVGVPHGGRYEVWLGGAVRGRAQVMVGGEQVGEATAELSYPGHFLRLGAVSLPAGNTRVAVRFEEGGVHPGSDGPPFPLGPVTLSPRRAPPRLVSVRPERARSLCGRRLDWIEVLGEG